LELLCIRLKINVKERESRADAQREALISHLFGDIEHIDEVMTGSNQLYFCKLGLFLVNMEHPPRWGNVTKTIFFFSIVNIYQSIKVTPPSFPGGGNGMVG
jgi:hypothetical protein